MKRYLTYNFPLIKNLYFFLSCATFFVEFFSFIRSTTRAIKSRCLSKIKYIVHCTLISIPNLHILDFWKENLVLSPNGLISVHKKIIKEYLKLLNRLYDITWFGSVYA